MKSLLFSLIFTAFIVGGCTNAANNNPVNPVRPTVSPDSQRIVGSWEYHAKDGSISSGMLMKDAEGHLYPWSDDRQLTVAVNWLFKIDVEYFGSRGTIPIGGEDLPLFMRGDLMTWVITIDYNGKLPLNLYPILYAQLNVTHREESGDILRWSEWEEILFLPPQSQVFIGRDMLVDTTLYPPNQIIRMEMELTCVFYQEWLKIFVFDSEDHWFFGG